ncbi:hypothetical protein [Bacillus sp. AFS055030]|uniref:hypothetical protein n=1 Tax=Bacillus sp. AFS055030 TaxID=2033507 RepID=UPI000BFE9401|nr:hypothetical protein [Bacillus sp. AFS055030]PGL72617.1 hypothetical protein CN925_04490 [Bacillus sp. AFS055030]
MNTYNNFITYLNSLNNASGSNENAIAEAQVTNPYYEQIRVERNIGKYLTKEIESSPIVAILTGHAGDGKTSLVYQVLRSLGLIEENSHLKIYDEVICKKTGKKFFYIKDMSELNADEQVDLLSRAFEYQKDGYSSIVVTNTGPLLQSFKNLLKKNYASPEKIDQFEMKLLEIMDKNTGLKESIEDYNFLLINMARTDNVVFVPKLINKLVDPKLWSECGNCNNQKLCPMYNNFVSVKENEMNVTSFITNYYRWLFENDRRLTIRQILAHISYAFTGNLNCKDVSSDTKSKQVFDYNFANLFFGYVGLEVNKNAHQIKAIQALQELDLDSKSLNEDYAMFVRNDFSKLVPHIQNIVLPVWKDEMKIYRLVSKNLIEDEKPYELRKCLRRIFIMFNQYDENEFNGLIDNLFSPIFSQFLRLRSNEIKRHERRELESMVKKALYFIFVGKQMEEHGAPIPIPLQRSGVGTQNVQLLYGEIINEDVKINQKLEESVFDKDENYHQLHITFKNSVKPFNLNFMLMDYFIHISLGAVSTKANPSLTHGLEQLKSRLFNAYRFKDVKKIQLLVHTLTGSKKLNLEIEDNELYVD